MSVITSEVSGGTRKGPHGRREFYVSGTGWVPAEQAPPDALKPKASPASGAPVRRKPKGPTQRQSEIWAAVEAHGGQTAAARALGITQGGVSSAVRGYAKAMERAGTPVVSLAPLDKRPASPAPLPTRSGKAESVAPRSESGKAEQGRRGAPVIDGRHTTDPAEPQAKSNGRTPDLNVEPAPGEPAATLAEMRVLPEPSELPKPPELPDLTATDELALLAHQRGYAEGYAVAVLRMLTHATVLDDWKRDMATDAADGLLG